MSDYLLENIWLLRFKTIFSRLKRECKLRYVKMKHRRELNQILILFVRYEQLLLLRSLSVQVQRFGLFEVFANKAAIGMRFVIDRTPFCLVQAHLSAHDYNYARRLYEYRLIVDNMRFDAARLVGPIYDHFSFFGGDLNFRLKKFPSDVWDREIDWSKTPDSKLIQNLLSVDQLRSAQKQSEAFMHYVEAPITFMPTYKYVINAQTLTRKRTPSYTDRILYRRQQNNSRSDRETLHEIRPAKYTALGDFKQSDHRPVIGVFDCIVTPSQLLKAKMAAPVRVTFLAPKAWKAFEDNSIAYSFTLGQPDEKKRKKNECKEEDALEEDFADEMLPNPWDWIGLFRSDYLSLDDYEAFVYVDTTTVELGVEAQESDSGDTMHSTDSVATSSSVFGEYEDVRNDRVFTTTFTYINLRPADYVLLYVRYDGCVYGQSQVFTV